MKLYVGLIKKTLRNDDIESWNTIVKWYDSESIEESLSASTLNKIIGLKLKDVYMGACSTFITTFVSYLDIFEEEEVSLPPRLVRDLFLMNITHENYSTIKNELRLKKKMLIECYEDTKSLSLNIETGQRKSQRQIRIQKQQEREKKGDLMFKGKKVNEFGFFIDKSFFKTLSDADKQSFYKKKDEWKAKGYVKDYLKTSDSSRSPAIVRNVKTELESLAQTLSPTTTDTGNSNDDDLKSVVSELTSADRESMGKAIHLLTSHMKITRTVRCNINNATRGDLKQMQVPATIDNGADTFMFGSDFRIFEWTDRYANVISFENSLQLENLRIGSGVTAYEVPDYGTVLLMVHEGIVNTTQPNSIFSVTQARNHGVNICDRHPKFKSDGRAGWFSMKVGEFDIPFHIHNELTSLIIRRPTDDEINTCPIRRSPSISISTSSQAPVQILPITYVNSDVPTPTTYPNTNLLSL